MKNYMMLILVTSFIFTQVNTEVYRSTKKDSGFTVRVDGNMTFADGNSEYSRFSLYNRLSYNKSYFSTFMILKHKRASVKDNTYQNQSFIHLRSIYTFSGQSQSEFFGQLEQNNFINLNFRSLLGVYYRNAIYNQNKNRLFYGIGVMYETENYGIADEQFNIIRMTNYLTVSYSISNTLTLLSVSYYQPDISNFSDYRILNNTTLNTPINDNLSLKIELDYRYDNKPFKGILTADLETSFGLSYRFN